MIQMGRDIVEEICVANKSDGRRCTRSKMYGCLCERHGRQVAQTPSGFQLRRVVRKHLSHLENSWEVCESSAEVYREKNGEGTIRTSSALTYRSDVISYLTDGEKTAGQIVEYLGSLSKFNISPSKVGQLMRTMINEGTVIRNKMSVDGVWGAVYALTSSEV